MSPSPAAGPAPKALIVPHAAYQYSGPIAASGYAALAQARDIIHRIVLLGPSHFIPFEGLALPHAEVFVTPLGEVRLERVAAGAIDPLAGVHRSDDIHAPEHSLEVQLPFLQELLGEIELSPLAVGEASPETIGRTLEAVWGGPETRIVVSSDLSHYEDGETARRLDRATARLIEQLRPEILPERACGAFPINGLLWAARRRRLHVATLNLQNSGDTAGSRDSVVGYGAFAFTELS
jgi:AmmeMemoRadiSam system protein B